MRLKICIVCLLMCLQTALSAQEKMLFLIAGQSNAVGQGNKDSASFVKEGAGYEYKYSSNNLQPLKDPFGEDTLYFQKANTGSIGPAFGKQLYEAGGIKAILLSAARGGASCSYKAELKGMGTWDTKGTMLLFEKAVMKTRKAMQLTGLPLEGIIWLQGERDANAINNQQLTSEEYAACLQDLINRFRKELGSDYPFYMVQTGYYTGFPQAGFDAVRKAQEEVAKKMKAVYIAYTNTNGFNEKGWMRDAIHYNQTGLNDIGKEVADLVIRQLKKQE